MRFLLLCHVLFWPTFVCAGHAGSALPDTHAFYVGANGGYGSTTWIGLVPEMENQNIVLSMSTPIEVKEGGGVWGGFAGVEFTPFFALEANYLAYPSATVFFDEDSFFAFENNGQTELNTKTQALSLMAKFMVALPKTKARAYSSLGVGGIHRDDNINNIWIAAPSFAVGLNYVFTEHVMGEVTGNYMSGYGTSELNPAKDYVPFLYAAYARIAYRV
jgi:hypothetical protein